MVPLSPNRANRWLERHPKLCIIALVLVCSFASYAVGRQTAQTEGCQARHVFEVGHNRLVRTIDVLAGQELTLNPQHYPPDEIDRRRATLRTFVKASRVPLEHC